MHYDLYLCNSPPQLSKARLEATWEKCFTFSTKFRFSFILRPGSNPNCIVIVGVHSPPTHETGKDGIKWTWSGTLQKAALLLSK